MKRSITILIALSFTAFGCGDDDSSMPKEMNNTNNGDTELVASIDLPAQAQLQSGTGGGITSAYLCEFPADMGYEFTVESGTEATPCESGTIFLTFNYDLAEGFYQAEAGATAVGGDLQNVDFISTTTGTINEEPTQSDRLEGIPETTSTTLETRDWLITFELNAEVVVITDLQPAP